MKMTKTFLLSMLLACIGCTEEINTKEVYVKGDSGKFPDYGEVLAFPVFRREILFGQFLPLYNRVW